MTTHHSAETASTPHPHGFATKPRAMTSERTRIKICGLTREQDVDAAVAAGADAVGFVLYAPSPAQSPLSALRNWHADSRHSSPRAAVRERKCYQYCSCQRNGGGRYRAISW